MSSSVMIFDDFFDNAEELRQIALNFDYPPHTVETYFPGQNSVQKLVIPNINERISALVGEQMVGAPDTSHEKCRLAMAESQGSAGVHIDNCHWSGIYYLTKPEDCQGGTDLFRHLPSGSDHAPLTKDGLADFGCSSFEELWRDVIKAHTNDESKWELSQRIPMKFNRLILFRPWYWHNAGPSFGTSVENGRLIYTLFFKAALSP